MKKKLICLALAVAFLLAVLPVDAAYKYNPFTRKLDYYEAGLPSGGGVAAGDVLYHNGTVWTNLARGANTDVLTLVAGFPAWVAAGAPGAHAATHELLGADLVDHDNLTNFVAAEHLLVGAIDHDSLLNYVAGQHLVLPGTIVATLTDHDATTHLDATIANDLTIASTANMSTTGSMTVGSLIGPAGVLDINTALQQDVNFWDTVAAGNQSINVFGWNTAGADRESFELTMDDANDEALIQVPNSVNNEGVTISLQETNQQFRVRQNADFFGISLDGSDTTFYNSDGIFIFDTGEAAAVAALVLYDDDTNFVTIQSQEMAANWVLTLPAIDGDAGQVLRTDGAGVTSWVAAAGAATWIALTDTNPANYVGAAGQVVVVDSDPDGLEFSAQISEIANGMRVSGTDDAILEFHDGTLNALIQLSDAEAIANNVDLRIGLDETGKSLIILDDGDIETDFGLAAQNNPTIFLYNSGASAYLSIDMNTIKYSYGGGLEFLIGATNASISQEFYYGNVNLTENNARQAFMHLNIDVNQTGTAAFDALYVDLKAGNAYGDGTTGDGNNLLNLSDETVPAFRVQRPADDLTHVHDVSALFDAVGLTDSTTLATIPANSVIFSIKMVLEEQFAGPGPLTDLDIEIGDGTDADGFVVEAMNLTSDAVGTVYTVRGALWNTDQGAGFFFSQAAETIVATATSVGCNLSAMTAGEVRFIITYMEN